MAKRIFITDRERQQEQEKKRIRTLPREERLQAKRELKFQNGISAATWFGDHDFEPTKEDVAEALEEWRRTCLDPTFEDFSDVSISDAEDDEEEEEEETPTEIPSDSSEEEEEEEEEPQTPTPLCRTGCVSPPPPAIAPVVIDLVDGPDTNTENGPRVWRNRTFAKKTKGKPTFDRRRFTPINGPLNPIGDATIAKATPQSSETPATTKP